MNKLDSMGSFPTPRTGGVAGGRSPQVQAPQMPRPNNPAQSQKFTVPPPPPQGGHPVRRLRMWQRAQAQANGGKAPMRAGGNMQQPRPSAPGGGVSMPAPAATGPSTAGVPGGNVNPVKPKGPAIGQAIGISATAPSDTVNTAMDSI